MVVLTLSPLGDLTRFRRKNFNYEAFLCTDDKKLRCNGGLLAARSASIEEMLEHSQNIPAGELSDDLPGLKTCLDLVYGGSVLVGLWNYKTIYKFGAIYKINEIMDGILSWISTELDYTDFWDVYLELQKLQGDPSVFIDTIKNYLSNNAVGFMQYTILLCQDHNVDKFTAIVDLLGEVLDKNILSIILNVADKATDNEEAPSSSRLPAGDSEYLQTVVSSTVCYIDRYSKSDLIAESDKDRLIKTLEKLLEICANIEICRSITPLIVSITPKKLHPTEADITLTTKTDLNWELVNTLTSPSTSYNTIRNFTERNAQVLHPCVTAEITLKWWSVNKDRETGDMGFITPLLTRINSVSNVWYNGVIKDSRYRELTSALGVTKPTVGRCISYSGYNKQLLTILQQYIRTGGRTTYLPEEWLEYTDNMKDYVDSLPAFRYSTDTVPQYGHISGHWFIRKLVVDINVSLITTTQEELLSELDNAYSIALCFVPNITQ